MTRREAMLLAGAVSAWGCRRYADFGLPRPDGSATDVRWVWEARPEPVLARGPADSWDSIDTLNPSVVRLENEYWNFYSGFDGRTWHTGLVRSADGVNWTARRQILSPEASTWEGGYIAANGAALRIGSEFFYWYQAGGHGHDAPPRIGFARSPDGISWRRHPRPVLDCGPRGAWDERGVADPYVVQLSGAFYLFYLGQDRARRQRLGVARSADGIEWWKLRSNPILDLGGAGEFDARGLGEPAVWAAHGHYWMLYTGRDRHEVRRMGMASSTDGAVWRKAASPVIAGDQEWNRAVICDATVLPSSDGVQVWFGGGDKPRPDEFLNGQIGYGVLRPVRGKPVTLAK